MSVLYDVVGLTYDVVGRQESRWRCEYTANEFRVSIKGNVGVYINLVLFMSVYLALDDELKTRSTAPAGHDVHSADLDWNLTMAQPSTATGLGM